VELVDVDMVGFQVGEGGMQVLPEFFRGLGHGLGTEGEPVPLAREGGAQLFLAVRVGPGGVEEGHAPLQGQVQDADGGVHVHPLDGQSPEAVLGGGDAGLSQGDGFHGVSPFSGRECPALFSIFYHIFPAGAREGNSIKQIARGLSV
jgi:hypothetical protein